MKISGSVGYTLLQKRTLGATHDKFVLLLSDIHDGVTYCEQDAVMIDNYLSLQDHNNVLLEEVLRENLTLTDLWPGSQHTQRLKQLNIKNKNIKPVDVRPMLLPFSWELIKMNKINQNITLQKYLILLDNFFNYKNTHFNNHYVVSEIKKPFDRKDLIITHFHIIKDKYNKFKLKHKQLMEHTIMDIYMNNNNVLESLNSIASLIMEWYIIILIHTSNKNTIIHVGLAHSEKILTLLTNVYQHIIIQSQGINRLENLHGTMNACIVVPPDIHNLFNHK